MGGKNRNLRSYIKENGIMRALYVDDIILNDSGMFTLSGKYEETLNEKIQENKDVLEVHGTLGAYNMNRYPWNMIGSNNWRKMHGFRMRRRKWLIR